MAGVYENGFERKTRLEIVEDLQDRAKTAFGEDVNLNSNSLLGKLIELFSYELAVNWQGQEQVYTSHIVDFATGVNLDYICDFIGISRKPATNSSVVLTFYGTDGTTIPAGTQVSTNGDDKIYFETDEEVEIGTTTSGEIDVDATSLEKGSDVNVAAYTLTNLVNFISGIDTVANSSAATGGTDEESDIELRKRYKDSVAIAGASTVDSIRAEINNIENVRAVLVKQNSTDSTVDGLLPHSIQAIVLDGEDEDIAEAIFDTVAAGIQTNGSTSVSVEDNSGNSHTIKFDRPTEIDIYVDIELTTSDSFPTNGDYLVEIEILKYIGGLDTVESTEYAGLSINENVIYTKLIDYAMNVEGVEDVSITVGTSDDPVGTSNITIDTTEIATTDTAKIDVSEV